MRPLVPPPVVGTFRERQPHERLRLGVGLALLVGEAPNVATVGRPEAWLAPAVTGRRHAGNRLGRWSGLRPSRFRAVFDRTNLFAEPPAPWPIAAARAQGETLLLGLGEREPRPTVLLGRKVCDAFGLSGSRFAGWYCWHLRHLETVQVEAPELEQLAAPCGSHGRELSVSDLELARRHRAIYLAAAPHPSSRSRLWNAPQELERARTFWTKLANLLAAWSDVLHASELAPPGGPC